VDVVYLHNYIVGGNFHNQLHNYDVRSTDNNPLTFFKSRSNNILLLPTCVPCTQIYKFTKTIAFENQYYNIKI
jgi:hypothetical protein